MKIIRIVNLKIYSTKASSGAPLGPILGQFKIPMADFCKDFNDKSSIFSSDILLPVSIYLLEDNSYFYKIHLPTLTFFFQLLLNRDKFSSNPGYFFLEEPKKGFLSLLKTTCILSVQLLYEILFFLFNKSIIVNKKYSFSILRSIISTLSSMGIFVCAL
jgi:ribosomal protein L11